jgi:hypothetical protein
MTAASTFPVTQFSHPRLSLPSPLMMSEPNTFAHYTLTQRWPAVVRRVIAEQSFPVEIQAALNALIQELPYGQVRSLRDQSSADTELWTNYLQPYLGQVWLDIPWFFAEVYFYRRILEATRYFLPGATRGLDPFAHQKRDGLQRSLDSVRTMTRLLTDTIEPERLKLLLSAALWGNQADLSLKPDDNVTPDAESELRQDYILVDDSAAVVQALGDGVQRVDIVADNAGFELVCDLCLADALLSDRRSEQVILHLKTHPTFVSDAIATDVDHTLTTLASDSHSEVRSLAHRLKQHLASHRLQLYPNTSWSAPLVCWESMS